MCRDGIPPGHPPRPRRVQQRPGTFTVLALDHRQNLRKELRPTDPTSVTEAEMVAFKRAVVRALGRAGTGILLDPEIGVGPAIADGSLAGGAGLIVAVEATGYEGEPGTQEPDPPGWGVAQVKRIGASAAKLLVYYHPDAPNAAEQERLVAEVAAACREADLALFLEPLSFGLDGGKLTGEERRRVVIETARRLTARARHPQGGVPVRRVGHRRGALGGGVRRAGRRDAGAVGAAVRRRGRRDVRAPGRDSLSRRRERRARRAVRVGGVGDAGARRAGCLPRLDGP